MRKGHYHTIIVTATDRMGRTLDIVRITRESRSLADQDRNKVYDLFNAKFTDHYIFVERIPESSLPLTKPLTDSTLGQMAA